jgi:hypothetical protein
MSNATNLTADSTDRTAALTAARASRSTRQPKAGTTRFGSTARRLLNALMRSLAAPHA